MPKKRHYKAQSRSIANYIYSFVFISATLLGLAYLYSQKYHTEPVAINYVGKQPTLPSPIVNVKSSIAESKMYFNDDTGRMNAEVTPWSLGTKATGGWYTYLISTFQSYMCSTPNNIFSLTTEEKLVNRGCKLRTSPDISSYSPNKFMPLWKRDYVGVFSAHLIPTSNNAATLYSINHNESFNNADAHVFNSSIPTCLAADDMGYGKLPCTPNYWWGSYNAWITMSSMPWNYQNLTSATLFSHHGPITWPSNGYIESLDGNATWIKATDGGVRHPSSIVKDNYLYVFYEDLSQGSEPAGRGPGIKVIRAEITASGISPNSFKAYYNGDFVDNALPPNFNLDTYYRSISRKGPRASSLFPELNKTAPQPTLGTKRSGPRTIGDVVSFQVAKINNSPYYLGIAHELSRGVTLRLSTDLVNWSNSSIVPGTESNWWSGGVDLQKLPFLYPRLSNKNGDSNTVIDADEFYILGTQTKNHNGVEAKIVNTMRLSVQTP